MATSCSSQQKTRFDFDNGCNQIMRKHIGVALGLCFSLTLLSVSSVSSAAPQIVGSKCVKAGTFRTAKNVKYQCKKSAQGLRWVITSPKSLPTTTTTSSTTTTLPVPRNEVSQVVQSEIQSGMASLTKSTTVWDFIEEDTLAPAIREALIYGLSRSLELFAQLGFDASSRLLILSANTEAGLRQRLLMEGCISPRLRDASTIFMAVGGWAHGDCGGSRYGISIHGIGTGLVSLPTYRSLSYQHILPHEAFHVWRLRIGRNCSPRGCAYSDFPRWLEEGGAQFMARIGFWSWNQERSIDQWFDYWYNTLDRTQLPLCRTVSMSEMADWPAGGTGGDFCAYSKGQFAIELLIAKYGGFRTLSRLFTERSSVGLNDFPKFFRQVTGQDLVVFYEEVEKYAKSRGW
jgi:hypothetical protein